MLFACASSCSDSSGGSSNSTGGNAGLGGAASGSGGSAGKGATGGAAGNASSVTWAEHIAPIVFENCAGCHRDGGIGPFSLTTYAKAAPLASLMAEQTAGRWMPPMPVDNSGACNTYSNARWLTDAEIALIEAWSAAGAPEGDPTRVPQLPPAPGHLDNPDAMLDVGEEYTPDATLADDYRCFLVDPGLTKDTFLVGYEVLPGDPRVVHHVIAYHPEDAKAVAEAAARDAAEPGLGYTCFGSAGVSAEPRVLWAPGASVITLPKGTGLPMAAGSPLILQVHYNLASGSFPDRTKVRMRFTDTVARPASYIAIADTEMNIAAGQAEGKTTRTLKGTDGPLVLHGALPHMHTLGRKLRVEASGSSGNTCLVNVDRWDFHWQNAWWYAQPVTLDLFKSATISCTYDTRNRNAPVTWGEGTSDEMCLSYFYATGP